MKKAFQAILCAGLLTPLFAASWVKQSDPFTLPGVGVLDRDMSKMSFLHLGCSYDAARGIVLFKYTLPGNTMTAKLNIYSVNGAKVKTFDLVSGTSSLQWSLSKERIATGIYFASLHVGSVEKNAQITIVK